MVHHHAILMSSPVQHERHNSSLMQGFTNVCAEKGPGPIELSTIVHKIHCAAEEGTDPVDIPDGAGKASAVFSLVQWEVSGRKIM